MPAFGDVFHFNDVPNLDNPDDKNRYVIVLDSRLLNGGSIGGRFVMCVGASASTTHESRILLPNKDDEPKGERGMPRRSWAVPEWLVMVPRCRFSGITPETFFLEIELKAIGDAVREHMDLNVPLGIGRPKRMRCLTPGCPDCGPKALT